MTDCNEMKLGEVYTCKQCGLELEVVKECIEAKAWRPLEQCECTQCPVTCCGDELVKIE
jgi:hypothetical protein